MSWIYCHTIPGDESMAGSSSELPSSSKSSVDTGSIPECEIWKDQKSWNKIPPFFGNGCYIFMHQTITLGTTAKKHAALMNRWYKLNFECSYMVYQRWTSECMASQSIQFHTNCFFLYYTFDFSWNSTPFLHLGPFGQSRFFGWVPQLS